MKQFLLSILLLISCSSLYCKSYGGAGFGLDKNTYSLHVSILERARVVHIGGNFFNARNSYNTYEPKPIFSNDIDKGKLIEAYWIGYGINIQAANSGYFVAAGLSMKNEFIMKKDSRIGEETYYIRKKDSNSIGTTLIVGSYMNVRKGLLGIALNLIPMNISINFYFPHE